ncbi:MAG TPA: hypothetical protein PKC58_16690 [Ignavibacteria bacterium]|nr:hypothetical protein [Ignavibacteria bacterium]
MSLIKNILSVLVLVTIIIINTSCKKQASRESNPAIAITDSLNKLGRMFLYMINEQSTWVIRDSTQQKAKIDLASIDFFEYDRRSSSGGDTIILYFEGRSNGNRVELAPNISNAVIFVNRKLIGYGSHDKFVYVNGFENFCAIITYKAALLAASIASEKRYSNELIKDENLKSEIISWYCEVLRF